MIGVLESHVSMPPAATGREEVRCSVKHIFCLVIAGSLVAFAADAASADAKKPAPRDFPALFSTLEKTDAVTEGPASPKRILYVFFDANCWYCHLTWKALQPYEKAGLQVRWVPVAYQKESSTTKAAAILLARDRAAAFRENETGYRAKSYDGGIAAVKATKALEAQLDANFELMDRFGVSGTPGLVWKDASGKAQVKTGMPRLSQLPAITGLPAQKIEDPELAEFR
jgi:thiol:disulfide interchange protein DsbG